MMEDGSHVSEIWCCFKEYVDKKSMETVAERYVDLCADFGCSDEDFRDAIGHDSDLDKAISYYLEDEEQDYDDDSEDEVY